MRSSPQPIGHQSTFPDHIPGTVDFHCHPSMSLAGKSCMGLRLLLHTLGRRGNPIDSKCLVEPRCSRRTADNS
eukprot:878868-Rhodomonas_salina.1